MIFTDGANLLSAALPLNGQGRGHLVRINLPAGENTIYAVYSGDANFPATSSSGTSITVQSNALLLLQPASYLYVAGNGNAGPSGDGGLATNAALDSPSTQAIDSFGNIYIADGVSVRVVASGKGTIPGISNPTAVSSTTSREVNPAPRRAES